MRLHLQRAAIAAILVGVAGGGCSSAATDRPAERTATARQALTPITQVTPGLGGGFHQELSVGFDTILASNSSVVEFFDRYGQPLDAGFGTGNTVGGTTLFNQFFQASSSSFINKNLPVNQQPTAGVPVWKTCDTTVDAWDDFQNNLAPAFVSSCIGNGVYDIHASFDPAHRRFIIAGHVRNNNWVYPTNPKSADNTVYPSPGPDVDGFSWRYTLIAVSKSENPIDGFNYYRSAEYYSDWPRVGVSGNFFVLAYHGSGSDWEAGQNKPLVSLYSLDDLANGVPTQPFTYTAAQLGLPYSGSDLTGGAGFLVVPTHGEPPDGSGSLTGAAYVMTKSAHGEVPSLLGFVPGSGAPSVISASMPASYAGVDPTGATIRDGFLYSTYEDGSNNFAHLDQQTISTTHSGSSASLHLQPTWGRNIGPTSQPAGYTYQVTAPMVEATGDGSAVVATSVFNGQAVTLEAHSVTFSTSGQAGQDTTWGTGPWGTGTNFQIDTRHVNRMSVDPLDPQSVWALGMKGTGGGGETQVDSQVIVNENVNATTPPLTAFPSSLTLVENSCTVAKVYDVSTLSWPAASSCGSTSYSITSDVPLGVSAYVSGNALNVCDGSGKAQSFVIQVTGTGCGLGPVITGVPVTVVPHLDPADQLYLSPGNDPLMIEQGGTGMATLLMYGPWQTYDKGVGALAQVTYNPIPGAQFVFSPGTTGLGGEGTIDVEVIVPLGTPPGTYAISIVGTDQSTQISLPTTMNVQVVACAPPEASLCTTYANMCGVWNANQCGGINCGGCATGSSCSSGICCPNGSFYNGTVCQPNTCPTGTTWCSNLEECAASCTPPPPKCTTGQVVCAETNTCMTALACSRLGSGGGGGGGCKGTSCM